MAGSATQFDQPVPQSRLRQLFFAWSAVCAGIRLQSYLILCKRVYEAIYRRSRYPLPSLVTIEQSGEITCTPNPASDPYWQQQRDDPDGLLAFQTDVINDQITRDMDRLEAEDARLAIRWQLVDEAIEQYEQEDAAAIRGRALPGKSSASRYASKCRPRLPFPWLPLAGCLALAFITGVESFQMSLPFLDHFAGVDTSNLPAEWSRNPLGVLGGVGLALMATTGLMVLWHWVITCAVAISTTWDTAGPGKTGLHLAAIVVLVLALTIGTFFFASLRHGMAEDGITLRNTTQGVLSGSQTGTGVFVFLTFLLPSISAYLLHTIRTCSYWQTRADRQAQQAKFDRDKDERLFATEAHTDSMDLLLQKRARIEQEQARLLQRRLALAERVNTAREERIEQLEQARLAAQKFVLTLIAALDVAKYYFYRAANRCKALHLLPDGMPPPPPPPGSPSRWQSVRALLTAGRNGHGS
jgi:hypothetical protein